MIQVLNNYWVCIGAKGTIDYTTVAYTRKRSIEIFVKDSSHDWNHWRKKYGWRCIKVNITFEEVQNQKL